MYFLSLYFVEKISFVSIIITQGMWDAIDVRLKCYLESSPDDDWVVKCRIITELFFFFI